MSIVGALLSVVGVAMTTDAVLIPGALAQVGGQVRHGGAHRGGDTPASIGDTPASVGPLRLGVPAYWSARAPEGTDAFDRLVAAAPALDTVIVNGPASGPAVPFDTELAAAIRRLDGAGVTVLGYVDTGYLGRTGQVTTRKRPGSTAVADWAGQAGADAAAWRRLYATHGLGGVFFDQTLPTCGVNDEHLNAYSAISGRVWGRWPDAVIAINPGTAVEECYTRVADIIVLAEDSFAAYRGWTPPAWVRAYPRRMFWHLVHGAATVAELTETLALARSRHAGRVFVTDAVLDTSGGPWNVLPADQYWSEQVRRAAATAERYGRGRPEWVPARRNCPRARGRSN